MKRTKNVIPASDKKADGILMSDLHLRLGAPVCREEDEFQESMWNKMDFIKELQVKHGCPVLCGGDFFHHWKPSPELISKTLLHIPANVFTIYGQHDLPNHSLALQEKNGIWTLKTAGALTLLPGYHWGQEPTQPSYIIKHSERIMFDRHILVWHKMNYQGKAPWPGCTDPRASGLLRKYSQFDLILTGDNHKNFVEHYDDRVLVNPGSLMRQNADQIDFKPRVYLYFADTNTVEPVYLPIKDGVVSRKHLDRGNQRDERIEAFISKIGGSYEAGLDFESNLEKFFQSNNIRQSVKEKVYKAIES